MADYEVRVLDNLIGPMFSWESQVKQYPTLGAPGIQYFAGVVEGREKPVDCLLCKDVTGHVRGILNHYPVDFLPLEVAGNVNIWVDPEWQRKGIATALIKRCIQMYGQIPVEQQKYTSEGVQLLTAMLKKGIMK
jgi:GNAT superfamily N-acetyltransferase